MLQLPFLLEGQGEVIEFYKLLEHVVTPMFVMGNCFFLLTSTRMHEVSPTLDCKTGPWTRLEAYDTQLREAENSKDRTRGRPETVETGGRHRIKSGGYESLYKKKTSFSSPVSVLKPFKLHSLKETHVHPIFRLLIHIFWHAGMQHFMR